ncbi:MAG: hypothetical protein AAF264_12810, partial [Pseudomonadota bacterium]
MDEALAVLVLGCLAIGLGRAGQTGRRDRAVWFGSGLAFTAALLLWSGVEAIRWIAIPAMLIVAATVLSWALRALLTALLPDRAGPALR